MTFRLPSLEEKAEYVLKQFDRIAYKYDLANDVISLGMHHFWKEAAVDALNINANGHYLDLCCGTGDLALEIAKKLNARGKVTGVDFSGNMLAIASRRSLDALKSGTIKIEINWLRATAERLPFTNRLFDGAIVGFGLRNLTNLEQGIAEMARVVKCAGTVVNLDLGHPSAPVFAPFYELYFNHLVPLVGQILSGDRLAYTYLPSSLKAYPKPPEITAVFEKMGLTDIVYRSLAFGAVALHKGTVA